MANGEKDKKDDGKIDVISELFSRVEENGVATMQVSDGTVFVFSEDVLSRLLEDSRNDPKKRVVVYVRKAKVSS